VTLHSGLPIPDFYTPGESEAAGSVCWRVLDWYTFIHRRTDKCTWIQLWVLGRGFAVDSH